MLHTRLRPHCKEFLEKIAKLYELHVFTFGSRLYAHTIAGRPRFIFLRFSHNIADSSLQNMVESNLVLGFLVVLPVCSHKRESSPCASSS